MPRIVVPSQGLPIAALTRLASLGFFPLASRASLPLRRRSGIVETPGAVSGGSLGAGKPREGLAQACRGAAGACAFFVLAGIFLGLGGPDRLIALPIAVASIVSSVAGFAFSAVSGALVFHLGADKVRLVEILMACSIVNQAVMSWSVRTQIDWRALTTSLAGGLLGLPLGVHLLIVADRRYYLFALGVFLVAYGLFKLANPRLRIDRAYPAADFAAGLAGGITGGAAAFPSAFVTIWVALRGLPKDRQRGIVQPYILCMQIAGLALIGFSKGNGMFGVADDIRNLAFIPFGLAGTLFGLRLYRGLSDRLFAMLVNAMLIVAGAGYLV